MDYDRNDALLHWLFRQTQGDAWFRPNEENISSGVALRISDASSPHPEFRVFPYENASLEPFESAVAVLNPVVAVKVRSAAVHAALAEVGPEDRSIYVDQETRIQILDTMLMLPQADKEQCAAFIRDERVMVIWSESLDRIIPICQDFEERLIKLLWRSRPSQSSQAQSQNSGFGGVAASSGSVSAAGSMVDHSSAEGLTGGNAGAGAGAAMGRKSMAGSTRSLKAGSVMRQSTGAAIAMSHTGTSTPVGGGGGVVRGLYGVQGREYDDEGDDGAFNRANDAFNDESREKSRAASAMGDEDDGDGDRDRDGDESVSVRGSVKERSGQRMRWKRTWYGKKVLVPVSTQERHVSEAFRGESRERQRKIRMYAPLYNGLAAGIALVFVGNSLRTLLMEWWLDNDFSRFALVAVIPLLYCVSMFFALQIVQNVTMMIGPIAHYHSNSKYYSAVRPRPNKVVDNNLPHITIQMPVYKESLEAVLAPSIRSLKKAMQTYARQGGTSTIFVCDDGLRLLSPAERDERLAFYANHNIGWVARPKHDPSPDGFKRAGRFKKASNMNYGLALSLKMEKHLEELLEQAKNSSSSDTPNLNNGGARNSLQSSVANGSTGAGGNAAAYGMQYQNRDGAESVVWGGAKGANSANTNGMPTPPISAHQPLISTPFLPPNGGFPNPYPSANEDLEEKALGLAIEETWQASGRRWRPWAANGRAIRVGEYVLLVDSDTVVPEDCLRDAAREMGERGNEMVAIIQHESDVMQVAHHYFENGIAYFTRRINRCISISCANGEVAPFMGHNAFLRWQAIQDALFIDPIDNEPKIWSESNVSEDFDMALRLILKGYIVRWATYSKGGFKEGVSLSVDDEINRWQKYAYGCNELLFNPFIQWWRKGPINKQIHTFLWSKAPLHYKISMLSYMFSYYGIAASITISLINYVVLGFQFPVDGFFMHSFEIFLATTVVFWGSGTVGYTLLEYRLGYKRLLSGLFENLMWIPFFFFFFGGLSIPVTQAILAHLFSYNIQWSATIKEVERSNFFKEIPKIARRFWFPMLFSFAIMLGMIICSTSLVPFEWKVDGSAWAVILPLSMSVACHILFPIVLNPWLMVFSY